MSENSFHHLKLVIGLSLVSSFVFLLQSLIELSKWLNQMISSNIPDLAVILRIDFIEWRGDIFIIFASFTITATLFTGLYHVLVRKETRLGIAFLLVGTGISFVIGSFFLLLNGAELFTAFLEFISEDSITSIEWKPKIWSSIVTMFICLPLLLVYKYLEIENK
ncbi:MAG: hypothetical protein ACTSW1_03400 [Candidatus Hodarchaeales archaeon]